MNPVAKSLILAGALMIILGLAWEFGGRFLHLGRLPGDVSVEKGNFRLYFPIATSIVVSIVLTILLNLLGRFFGK